jgi:hypothetical protein
LGGARTTHYSLDRLKKICGDHAVASVPVVTAYPVRFVRSAESAAIQQCFSLTTNQRTVLSATMNQRNEQVVCSMFEIKRLLCVLCMCAEPDSAQLVRRGRHGPHRGADDNPSTMFGTMECNKHQKEFPSLVQLCCSAICRQQTPSISISP